jgi:hypothetical protein
MSSADHPSHSRTAAGLIVLLVITGIIRKRFNANGKAWRWRAIHYTNYVALGFGVWHGLLGGRSAAPYVDWSYGCAIGLTALRLTVRIFAQSQRSKANFTTPLGAGPSSARSIPLRTASLAMAPAQPARTVRVLPADGLTPSAATGRHPAGMSYHPAPAIRPAPQAGTRHQRYPSQAAPDRGGRRTSPCASRPGTTRTLCPGRAPAHVGHPHQPGSAAARPFDAELFSGQSHAPVEMLARVRRPDHRGEYAMERWLMRYGHE